MKIIIAGGTGYLGKLLIEYYKRDKENQIYVLTRSHKLDDDNVRYLNWNGVTVGYWVSFLENSDVLINLSGKSVNCRYTESNKREIYNSRLLSTDLLCRVVKHLNKPPKVFIQSSSATIYEHSENKFMTESKGNIGIDFSMDVCKKWEKVFNNYNLAQTKKIITRTSIVLGNKGGAFPLMKKMTSIGLGGKQGRGTQYVSWISEDDYVKAIDFLINKEEGVYNVCSPNPITNRLFQNLLRKKMKVPFGLNLPKMVLNLGAIIMGTETELLLKSRKVFPEKLLKLGFNFQTVSFNEFKI
ncbi:TIGR01777 family oxidoreductase [Tenacibaculum xiamenense]|uniref:TIGR01777 family oxidoreductase n=1 Tax=Tenacibaculum xiamenense TaxID=1261553 RepID=UPI0038939AA2